MWGLKFPREVATPQRRKVLTKEEYIGFINANISVNNLFTTVYFHPQWKNLYTADYDSAIIDRVYFDCDFKWWDKDAKEWKPTDGYISMLKLHEWCQKNGNIKHLCCMTGTGYNVIIAAKELFYKNKADTISNANTELCKDLDIKTDASVRDLARITRILNTFNFKPSAQRFAIPLKEEQLYLGHEAIREIAKKQQFCMPVIGDGEWDLTEYDTATNVVLPEIPIENFGNIESEVKECPNCIKRMLMMKEQGETIGWHNRPILISWLRDNGYLYEETLSILRKHMSDREYRHCVFEERQPQYYYRNMLNLYSYRCHTIQERGLCDSESEKTCNYRK